MFLSPKPIVTQLKEASANGSRSAFASTHSTLRAKPASSRRSRPWASIAALMSESTTWPVGPTCRASPVAMSPVPPATSSARCPGLSPVWASVKRFHSRWMPKDIMSFMTS